MATMRTDSKMSIKPTWYHVANAMFPCAALWQKNGSILLLTCSLKAYCFNSLWAFSEYKVVQGIPPTIRSICLIFCILKFIKYFHLLLHLILKKQNKTLWNKQDRYCFSHFANGNQNFESECLAQSGQDESRNQCAFCCMYHRLNICHSHILLWE